MKKSKGDTMRTIKGVPVETKLRQRAEEKLKDATVDSIELSGMSPEKIAGLIHELQVHQIELEMQNDELRRVQVELEKTRDKYSHLYDFAPVGYLTISDKGIILEANLSCANMLGIERQSLIGMPFSHFIFKDDQDIFYLNRMKLIETKSKQIFELRIMKKEGTQFYSQLESITTLIDDSDQIQIRIVMTDVSELAIERDNLVNILGSMEDGVYISDQSYKIQYLNPALEKEFGPVDGKKCFEYFNDLKDPCPWCKNQDVFSGKTAHREWYCAKNQKTYDLIDTPLRNPGGSLSKLEIFRDITEFRAIQNKLQTAYDDLEKKVEERTVEIRLAREAAIIEKQTAIVSLFEIKELKEQLEAERAYLQEEIKLEYNHENIIGKSDGLKYVLYKVEQIARTETNVLILGETGTGKELVARAIHNMSNNKNRAMVKVNCATLPTNLIESELFGHEKGAFTGAHSRHLGRFEVANGTTIFLDEIGELPLELQAKLLRVIQDGEFERLGSSYTVKVKVRIIAATNRNLEEEVKKGRFREDLWYRLNVFPITMPPLRDRLDDIPLLVEYYVKKITKRMGKSIEIIPANIIDTLQKYHWPGNIRELENVLERAIINSSGPKLRLVDILKTRSSYISSAAKTLEAVEREHIMHILDQTQWKVSGKNGAAEILGLNRSTLRAKMRKLGIIKP
jgi:PAS domain S-box-containing protein